MTIGIYFRRLVRDQTGSSAVEFAILGPVFVTMMFAILQIGMAMQNYNAVRNVAADVSRHATVQFLNGRPMTDADIVNKTVEYATASPYLLNASQLQATCVESASPTVTGTIEKTLTITYQVTTLVSNLGLPSPSMTYSRLIIVTST